MNPVMLTPTADNLMHDALCWVNLGITVSEVGLYQTHSDENIWLVELSSLNQADIESHCVDLEQALSGIGWQGVRVISRLWRRTDG